MPLTMPESLKEAYVTLATNDLYGLGCLVLGRSLRRSNTNRQLVVMVTDGVSQQMKSQMEQIYDLVHLVDLIDSRDPINLNLLGRPDLNVTFTKLHCWKLTQYTKAVFLDADTLVIRNVDDLFDREELSAAPDAGWPDCFNSGVFVFRPSIETYNSILQFALTHGSFDGGDQGLLNSYFSDWSTKDISKHLPFLYNVVSQAFYSYLPAFAKFRDDVRIVHFIGALKPWHHTFNKSTGEVLLHPKTEHDVQFLKLWWTIFLQDIRSTIHPELSKMLIESVASYNASGGPGGDFVSFPQPKPTETERKLAWERGEIDYLGDDSFENIQKKLDSTIETGTSESVVSASKSSFPSVPVVIPSVQKTSAPKSSAQKSSATNSSAKPTTKKSTVATNNTKAK